MKKSALCKISARAFQRVFTCKIWLRYSRERALISSKVRALGNLNWNFKISNLLLAAQNTRAHGAASPPLHLPKLSTTAPIVRSQRCADRSNAPVRATSVAAPKDMRRSDAFRRVVYAGGTLVETFDIEPFSDFTKKKQTLEGSFSAVSKATIATKYSFCRVFRDLQDLHSFAPLHIQNLQIFSFLILMIFRKMLEKVYFCWNFGIWAVQSL